MQHCAPSAVKSGGQRCKRDYIPCKGKERQRADKTHMVVLCSEAQRDISHTEWGTLLLLACFEGREKVNGKLKKLPCTEE